jgi:hypothetical protein
VGARGPAGLTVLRFRTPGSGDTSGVLAVILFFWLGLRAALFELMAELVVVLLLLCGGGGGRARRSLDSMLAELRHRLTIDAA